VVTPVKVTKDRVEVTDLPTKSIKVHRSEGIHVSDRILFKRCRRKWYWSSPTRQGLQAIGDTIAPLWFGTAFHFALEDFHGYNRFGQASTALEAFFYAHKPNERPSEWEELLPLGKAMLDYYQTHWLKRRNEFKTLWIDGVPQTEVDFAINLPRRRLPFQGTFDRIAVDPYGRLWVVEYKTAARSDSIKLETDPQVTSYALAASVVYGRPFEGVVYLQFVKTIPTPPKRNKDGTFSKNKNQPTSYALYRQALEEAHEGKVPASYVDFLNYLISLETPEGDRFITRAALRRNEKQQRAELMKILAESRDMLDPKLPLYPNPTRDCNWDCPFRTACIALDDGSDYKYLLEMGFTKRSENEEWRARLEYPEAPDLAGTVKLPRQP
jgi:hypothetical protein